jgi:hypothetical protein
VSAYSSLSRDVFDCSELERAAHSVSQAQRYLASLSLSTGSGSVSASQRLDITAILTVRGSVRGRVTDRFTAENGVT